MSAKIPWSILALSVVFNVVAIPTAARAATSDAPIGPTSIEAVNLRGVIDRYGCVNNSTVGVKTLDRYTFAAVLNSCNQQLKQLQLTAGQGALAPIDITTMKHLMAEFAPELRVLSKRVNTLQSGGH